MTSMREEQESTQESKRDSGIRERLGSWLRDSISGINIVQRIQSNLRCVFGLSESDFETESGREFIAAIDLIVRKGKPITTIFEKPEVWHSFEALVNHFSEDTVTITLKSGKEQAEQEFKLFQSLHQYALVCRSDEHRILDYQKMLESDVGFFEKRRLQKQIAEAKARISDRTSMFQKLVFSEADRIERGEPGRVIEVDGQAHSFKDLTDGLLSLSQRFESLNDDGPPLSMDESASGAQDGDNLLRPAPLPFDTPASVQIEKQADKESSSRLTLRKPPPRPALKPADIIEWQELTGKKQVEEDEIDKSFRLDF